MARERYVTRTIYGVKANVLCMDTENATATAKEFTIGGVYPDNEKLLKALQTSYQTETLKLVHIVSTETTEQLFGMPEADFIKYAKKLDARYVKQG